MVDFKKRLAGKKAERPTDPVKLYDTLDRAHDKGPLRPAQAAVLKDWFASHREQQDVIVKLHTGQGKTLIGLTDGKLMANEVMVYIRRLGTVEAKVEGRAVLK